MNWYGTSRSNYFRVKDDDAFRQAMTPLHAKPTWNGEGKVAVFGSDEGGWPTVYDTEGNPTDEEFHELVVPHLADGEVAVFITVGAEGQRYLSGYAMAFNNAGEVVDLDLDRIYQLATERFGVTPTQACY